ncbi:MAG: sugar ABC transporter ATP-binding protein [Planctomycetaceae bacterium]|uniref:Galactose/methyl galactoside import ATP-binding protein MglA n=2 Tax=Lacipirellula limnantheis TaxID=2528024 RepID=A0A517U0Q2_9BACT|nr:sugar ABC transporter ATP-binding protein [Planctomycetaceae bacterium]QDT74200.1 Galactose/methyl galactoside import ATP-binding protein MglA [Lacipirellula limnantheis]
MPPRLAMSGVRHRYGATQALSGVDLEVRSGEVHALVGENGAGKSTLMKILSGALIPDAGSMQLDGEPYRPQTPADGRAAGVAMIYQELSLAPDLSVAENISLGVEPTRGPFVRRHELRERARAALAEIGRPELPLDLPAGRLSVAEQQLVEIARSVATGCRILVLDEPTSTLSQQDVERLFTLIRRLRERGLAIVYISHFLEEVKAICDRFTALRDGQTTGSGDAKSTPADRIVAMMVGRAVDDLYPRTPRTCGETVLSIRDLAGVAKPESATLDLRRGEVVGIAGIIGAGRTELLRALMGLDPVARGTVRVATLEGWQSPSARWRQGMGLVSEDRKREGLALELTIAENITLPKLSGLTPRGWVTPAAQDRASQPLVERLGIKCRSPRQPVGALSGGNQQKVAIARLLHADVDMLLLDEPTRGIDVGSKAEICRLINELAVGDSVAGRAPKAVLIVSSYLPELLGLCDRIAVMCRGRLGDARPVEAWSEHEIMLAATGAKTEPART